MRKYYWYLTIFIQKHGKVVLFSSLTTVIFFSLALPTFGRQLDFHQTKYIGLVGKFSIDTLPDEVSSLISSGLTRVESDGSTSPLLAERWVTEDEGKTFRFLLKKNLFWQDGKPLTPADLTYNFADVEIITTPTEIIFKMKNVFAPFPTLLARPIVRRENHKKFFFFDEKTIIGTGQYQVTSFKESGNHITEISLKAPTLSVVYRFYLTQEDAQNAFMRGEVDILPHLSSPGELNDWPTVEVTKKTLPNTYVAVFFNTQLPLFSSNELRQALNYSVHKPTDETRTKGPLSTNSWAFKDVNKPYDFDQYRAIERLLKAPPREPIQFELTSVPLFAAEAEKIASTWQELGDKAAKVCHSDSEIKEKVLCDNMKMKISIRLTNFPDTSNFQALLIGQTSPLDPDQYSLWHSESRSNFTHYNNTRIDTLLVKGRQVIDSEARQAVYQDFQQFLGDDVPVIFIRYLDEYEVKRKGVK